MTAQPRRLLLSYAYYATHDLDALIDRLPERPLIFADSGAFTAHWQGTEITVDDYAAWVERWGHLFTVYANLDVIGDAAGSLANQRALEARGLRPLPVFHGGESWDFLRQYVEEYEYVCLGGMVTSRSAVALRWAAAAFAIGEPHGTRFHGFGQTRMPVLKALPWGSVDSSSWGSGHRYGRVRLWDSERAKFVAIIVGRQRSVYAHAALLRDHLGDPAVFARPGCAMRREGVPAAQTAEERGHVSAVSAVAWMRLEEWLRARHGGDRPDVYLVDGSPTNVVETADAFATLRGLVL